MLPTLKDYVKESMKSWWNVKTCLLDIVGLFNRTDAVLGEIVTIPTTYAGGARCTFTSQSSLCFLYMVASWNPLPEAIEDLDLVDKLSSGRVDLTYGR